MRSGKWDTVGGSLAIAGTIAFVLGMLWVMPAFAADKGGPNFLELPAATAKAPWSGVYLGVHAGYGIAIGDVSQDDAFIKGLSADGAIGGVHGGIDYQLAGSKVVVGVRGAYTWSNMQFSAGDSNDALEVGVKDGWSADARLGYAMDSALPYVFAGYTKVKTSVNEPDFNAPDLEGWRAGVGVEWRMPENKNVTLGLEYAFTDYKSVTIGEICPIDIDPTDHRFMARLNFRLGGK